MLRKIYWTESIKRFSDIKFSNKWKKIGKIFHCALSFAKRGAHCFAQLEEFDTSKHQNKWCKSTLAPAWSRLVAKVIDSKYSKALSYAHLRCVIFDDMHFWIVSGNIWDMQSLLNSLKLCTYEVFLIEVMHFFEI